MDIINIDDLKCCGNCYWYLTTLSNECSKCNIYNTCQSDILFCKFMWCRCSKFGHSAKGYNKPCSYWEYKNNDK